MCDFPKAWEGGFVSRVMYAKWYRWKALDLSFQNMIFSIFSIRGARALGAP